MSDKYIQDQSLVIADRINYPAILAISMLKFFDVVIQPEGSQSEQAVRESVLAEFNSIPESWVDNEFIEDVASSVETIEVDDRPEFCGVKVGKPQIRKEEKINPFKLHHACVNLYQRRGILSRPVFREVATGRHFKPKPNEEKE